MARKLSDDQYRKFVHLTRELERRVDNKEIPFDSVVDALNRIIHRGALLRDPISNLYRSGLYNGFTIEQAIVAVNLLEMDGFTLNLTGGEECHITDCLHLTENDRSVYHGIYSDFTDFRKGQLEHGINVTWYYTPDRVSSMIIDSPGSQKLEKWPCTYEPTIKMMARGFRDTNLKYSFMTLDGAVFYL